MQVNNTPDDVVSSDAVRKPRLVDDSSPMRELDQRRMDDIRSKILAGAYHTNEMAEAVARALLRGNDI